MKKNPVVHFEMPYEDTERASDFYKKAFDWGMQMTSPEMGNYILAQTTETDENQMVLKPGTINGGFFEKDENNKSAHYPSIVIQVENIKESMKNIEEAGGKVLGEPVDIPTVGFYVSFVDTEGNRVSILEPKEKNES